MPDKVIPPGTDPLPSRRAPALTVARAGSRIRRIPDSQRARADEGGRIVVGALQHSSPAPALVRPAEPETWDAMTPLVALTVITPLPLRVSVPPESVTVPSSNVTPPAVGSVPPSVTVKAPEASVPAENTAVSPLVHAPGSYAVGGSGSRSRRCPRCRWQTRLRDLLRGCCRWRPSTRLSPRGCFAAARRRRSPRERHSRICQRETKRRSQLSRLRGYCYFVCSTYSSRFAWRDNWS